MVPEAGKGRMEINVNLAAFLSVPVLDTFGHACRLLRIHLTAPLATLVLRESSWLNQGDQSGRSGKGRVIIIHLLILKFVQSTCALSFVTSYFNISLIFVSILVCIHFCLVFVFLSVFIFPMKSGI